RGARSFALRPRETSHGGSSKNGARESPPTPRTKPESKLRSPPCGAGGGRTACPTRIRCESGSLRSTRGERARGSWLASSMRLVVVEALRVLVAGWVNSPHVAAWAELVKGLGHDVHIAGRAAPGWPELDL